MRKNSLLWLAPAFLGGALISATAMAESYFEVTVTNITKGVVFTPIMVASTKKGTTFFKLGEPASPALETIAETGNPGPLQESLDAFDVTNSSFLPFLAPGESVTQKVATEGKYDHVSVAAMIIPTNDVFFAVNSIQGPKSGKSKKSGKSGKSAKSSDTVSVTVGAYDAGTEINDELCASLPGPGCGPDPGPVSDGEGYVHPSSGIRGVGDLDADALDWNNPVALIEIRRVKD
jgi:hypothetical protein